MGKDLNYQLTEYCKFGELTGILEQLEGKPHEIRRDGRGYAVFVERPRQKVQSLRSAKGEKVQI